MIREKFEEWYLANWKSNCAWASEKTIADVSAERQGDGYPGGYMQGCWEGFQAAIASMQSEHDADKRRIDVLRQDKDKLIDTSKERISNLLSRAEAAENRLTELEARTLNVKLPPEVQGSNIPFAADGANAMRKEVVKALTEACAAAGISLKIEGE